MARKCLADFADLTDQLRRRDRRDPRPLAMGDGNQTHVGQGLHRLPDSGPPDLEHLHKLAFGRKLIAGGILAAGNAGQQTIQHLLIQFAARDRVGDGHCRL